jgi:hypothetical protein
VGVIVMNELAEQIIERVRTSLPTSLVYWEKDPTEHSLHGAILTAEFHKRKFTMQFESADGDSSPQAPDEAFIEQVVDDFTDFFSRTIYPKEKFTRII